MSAIKGFRELRVYRLAVEAAMEIFELTKTFPPEEKFSMVDQVRRSSRSICANLAESWRKRRYKAHFISKISDAEGEAEETRVWLELAFLCKYINQNTFNILDDKYDHILAQLVKMSANADQWTLKNNN